MRILKVRYRDAQEFLQSYDASFPCGGLIYPTRQQLAIGEPVIIELAFPELAGKIMLKGRVAWRRPGQHRLKVQAGLGIELLPSEIRRRDYVLSVARGQGEVGVQRRHRRLPVSLPTRWRVRESRGAEESRLGDIGPGGAFVLAKNKPDIGTELILDVTLPGSVAPISVAGRVAWTTSGTHAAQDLPARTAASNSTSGAGEQGTDMAASGETDVPESAASPLGASDEATPTGDLEGLHDLRGRDAQEGHDAQLGQEGTMIAESVAESAAAAELSESGEGFGVEFRARDAGGVRRLRELVRRLERLPS